MKSKIIVSVIVLAIVVVGAVFAFKASNKPGIYDGLATCLADKGAKFYGAFWCPHCATQKKLFGNSVKKLPYVECSTADAKGQTQVCIDNDIKSYPTWIFADGARVSGEQTLEFLAGKTQCTLPDGTTPPVPEIAAPAPDAASPAQ